MKSLPPQLFTKNQDVVCVATECKPTRPELANLPDVHYRNLYKIKSYEWFKFNVWFVSVHELPDGCIYSEDSFAPLMCIKELMAQREIIHREFAHFINFPALYNEYHNDIQYERIKALKAMYEWRSV